MTGPVAGRNFSRMERHAVRRLAPAFAALLLALAPGGAGSLASAQDAGAIEACGTVQAYTPATSTVDGSLTIGTRTYVLAADDLYRQQAERNQTYIIGRPTCLTGAQMAGRVSQYSAIGFPAELCGTVLAFRAPSAGVAGSVTLRDLGEVTLAIPPGSAAGPAPAASDRACFTLALDRSGDAVASGRVLTIAERTAVQVNVCGTVSAWTRPAMTAPAAATHEVDGSITVGTHRFVIAAGTVYSLVNAFPVVGQPACLGGALDDVGRLIQYGAQPWLPGCIGGPVATFLRPTATTAGSVRFALPGLVRYTADSRRFGIPAGTLLPANADDGSFCFTVAIGSDGDAIATGVRSGGIGSLPNTSTR